MKDVTKRRLSLNGTEGDSNKASKTREPAGWCPRRMQSSIDEEAKLSNGLNSLRGQQQQVHTCLGLDDNGARVIEAMIEAPKLLAPSVLKGHSYWDTSCYCLNVSLR